MSDKLESLKTELVEEIRQLANDLAKNQSFIGLLSYESKFNLLHEKFVTLKFLERRHLGLDIFDSPIPPDVESHDTELDAVKNNESLDYALNPKAQDESIDNKFEENVMDYTEECIDIIEDREKENKELIDAEISDNTESVKDLDDFKDLLPGANLPKIQIDFNDRMAFLNQLFEGNQENMDSVIQTLNHMNSLSDAKAFLADIGSEFQWKGKEEYIMRLYELIEKRFD